MTTSTTITVKGLTFVVSVFFKEGEMKQITVYCYRGKSVPSANSHSNKCYGKCFDSWQTVAEAYKSLAPIIDQIIAEVTPQPVASESANENTDPQFVADDLEDQVNELVEVFGLLNILALSSIIKEHDFRYLYPAGVSDIEWARAKLKMQDLGEQIKKLNDPNIVELLLKSANINPSSANQPALVEAIEPGKENGETINEKMDLFTVQTKTTLSETVSQDATGQMALFSFQSETSFVIQNDNDFEAKESSIDEPALISVDVEADSNYLETVEAESGNTVSLTAFRNKKAIAKEQKIAAEEYRAGEQGMHDGTFQIGSIYTDRSAANNDVVFTFKVIDRSKTFVTLEENGRLIGKKKVYTDKDGEWCMPHGKHSMCTVLRS